MHKSNSQKIEYNYTGFEYSMKGIRPSAGFSNADRIYIGLGYTIKSFNWKKPAAPDRHSFDVHYSISQKAFSAWHSSVMPKVFGEWGLVLNSSIDAVRWTNFYGTGNESIKSSDDIDYNRVRTREWNASAGVRHSVNKHSSFGITGFFQSVKILNDTGRYVVKIFQPIDTDALENNQYAGGLLSYSYVNVDDSILPLKGIVFQGSASLFGNVSQKEFFQNYGARFQCFIPLSGKFSLAFKGGATTIVTHVDLANNAEFYEHAVIGGPENFRGYQRERFWGKSAVYNQNEFRFITNIRNRLMNAKAGLLVFSDNGRVWLPGEDSNQWHTAYGGGIILSPFHMLSATLTYDVSNEDKLIQIKLNHVF